MLLELNNFEFYHFIDGVMFMDMCMPVVVVIFPRNYNLSHGPDTIIALGPQSRFSTQL